MGMILNYLLCEKKGIIFSIMLTLSDFYNSIFLISYSMFDYIMGIVAFASYCLVFQHRNQQLMISEQELIKCRPKKEGIT